MVSAASLVARRGALAALCLALLLCASGASALKKGDGTAYSGARAGRVGAAAAAAAARAPAARARGPAHHAPA